MTNAPREDQALAQIAFEESGVVFAALRNVGIAIFASKPSLDTVQKLRMVTTDLARDYGKTSTLYVTLSSTPLPDAPVRGALQTLTNEVAKDMIAVASLIFGNGFWASAIRAFATSVHWMNGHAYDKRVFSKSDEASQWIASLHSAKSLPIHADTLDRELTQLLDRPTLRLSRSVARSA